VTTVLARVVGGGRSGWDPLSTPALRRRPATAAPVFAVLAALVVGVAAAPASASAAKARTWLAEINYYRTGAGLKPVANNAGWDKGIRNHLKYLQKTSPSLMTGQYASAHTENPKSPYYTKSGAQEGSRSDLLLGGGVGTPLPDIDNWLTAPFHAIGMLRTGLTKVAFASGFAGAGLDVLGGLTFGNPPAKPIMFPGRNVTTNLTAYSGNELPNPLQSCHYPKAAKSKPVGLPIIVLLPKTPAKKLTATLAFPHGGSEGTTGRTLCLVDQFTYHSTDTVYGPTGLEILKGDHAVLLFPSGHPEGRNLQGHHPQRPQDHLHLALQSQAVAARAPT